jgi:hypothetical protein
MQLRVTHGKVPAGRSLQLCSSIAACDLLLALDACLCRFVDPNDPSTIYLSQPAAESQRLQYQPAYAPNYGQDEKYEPMAPHH